MPAGERDGEVLGEAWCLTSGGEPGSVAEREEEGMEGDGLL